MRDSKIIELFDGVPYLFPPADKGDVQSYEEVTLTFNSTVNCLIEFDYGLAVGFSDSFLQSKANDTYNARAVKRVRITVTGDDGEARLTFQKRIIDGGR
jgi:hypothetical protein